MRMTGRYLIFTPVQSASNELRFAKAWRLLVRTCMSLNRDQLSYSVEWNLSTDQPHALITASGTAKPRTGPAMRPKAVGRRRMHQQCQSRKRECEWILNAQRDDDHASYWRRRHARYKELSEMGEEILRAELDFWRELEALSGQRQRFPPGRAVALMPDDDQASAA